MSNTINIATPNNIIIDSLPIGFICPFAGANIPSKYLLCDGSAISRTDYKDLFDVIGTTYGEGDGELTFNLPDFRNKVIWGGDLTTLGTVLSAGLPNITGSLTTSSSASIMNGGEWYEALITNAGALSSASWTINKAISEVDYSGGQKLKSINFNASKSNNIYGNSETVQPPAITILILIKYQ